MKKKIYQQPEIKVVELDQADLICTSPQGQIQSLEDDDSYEELF